MAWNSRKVHFFIAPARGQLSDRGWSENIWHGADELQQEALVLELESNFYSNELNQTPPIADPSKSQQPTREDAMTITSQAHRAQQSEVLLGKVGNSNCQHSGQHPLQLVHFCLYHGKL